MAESDIRDIRVTRSDSIKALVYHELRKNPTLTARYLCQILKLDYRTQGDYVAHVRSAWKSDPKNEQGSKCSIHAWRGWTFVPLALSGVVRAAAEGKGWIRTRARNRWLLWRDPKLGRLQWFETGRLNVYVRKPATMGKAVQLIAMAFSWTELITDLRLLQAMFKGIQFKGAHYVIPLGYRGEKPVTVDLFGASSGIIIKLFDRSHPTSLEVLAHYPDWAERNETLFSQLLENIKLFTQVMNEKQQQAPEEPEKPERPGRAPYWV